MGEKKYHKLAFDNETAKKLIKITERVSDFIQDEIKVLKFDDSVSEILAHYFVVKALARATNEAMEGCGFSELKIEMGTKWERNGNEMGTKWERNGNEMGTKWDEMGR